MPPFLLLLFSIVALFAACLWLLRRALPGLLLPEQRSAHGLDETVTRLTDAAKAAGWVVQGNS